MRPQLQKTLLVPLSSSGRSDFNIQHGETRSSCSQEEALRPAWVKEAVSGGSEGGGGVGGGGAGVLLRSSPLYSVFITAESWRESEPGGVSHQHRVLKEGRRLQRPRGTFSFLASARDPRSSSPAPRSVGEHRECLKEQFTRNQSSAVKNFYISHIIKKKKKKGKSPVTFFKMTVSQNNREKVSCQKLLLTYPQFPKNVSYLFQVKFHTEKVKWKNSWRKKLNKFFWRLKNLKILQKWKF